MSADESCTISQSTWLTVTARKLTQMWKDSQLCDLKLKSQNDQELHCHSCILAANIPFIKAKLLTLEATSSKMELSFDTINLEVMTSIVDFCYGGTIVLPQSKISDLKNAAAEIKFNKLAKLCDRIMERAHEAENSSETTIKQEMDTSTESYYEDHSEEETEFFQCEQMLEEEEYYSDNEVAANEISDNSLNIIKEEVSNDAMLDSDIPDTSTTGACSQNLGSASSVPSKGKRVRNKDTLGQVNTFTVSYSRKKASDLRKKYKTKKNTVTDKGNYRCRVCAKRFQCLKIFADHMNIHKGLKPYSCSFCERKYSAELSLRDHLKTHKGEEYPCELCGKVFYSKKTVYRHRRNHPPDFVPKQEKLECLFCFKVFKHKNSLDSHTNRHKGIKPYKCDECGKEFHNKETLKLHTKDHQGRSFACTMCSKILPTLKKLNRHIKEHGEKVYEQTDHIPKENCTECDRSFHTKPNLRRHMRLSHGNSCSYMCQACGKVLKSQSTLQHHIVSCTGVGKFPCDFCDKLFAMKESFKKHLQRCHMKECLESEKYKSDVSMCSFCGQGFLCKRKLRLHEALHKNENLFQCEKCGKSFQENGYLIAHINTVHNTQPKQFNCDAPGCPKAFKTEKSLKRHQRVHKGVYRYFCDYCAKGYDKMSQVENHKLKCMQGPAGSKNTECKPEVFECDMCNKVVKSKQALSKHRNSHKTQAKLSCENCGKKYPNQGDLTEHRSNCRKQPDSHPPQRHDTANVSGDTFGQTNEAITQLISSECKENSIRECRETTSYLQQMTALPLPNPFMMVPQQASLPWPPQPQYHGDL